MPEFSYKAVEKGGGYVTGSIEASDRNKAVSQLAQSGRFVTEVTEKAVSAEADKWTTLTELKLSGFAGFRVRRKDILSFTSQLSTAIRAGLPLFEALSIIRRQQSNSAMIKLLGELSESVRSGSSLSEAMANRPDIFNNLYLSMIRVGETGGILEQTTVELTRILERDEKIKTNMKNASAYPVFVLCVGLVSVVIVVTWILPRILSTISVGVVALPLPTRILLVMSGFFKSFWWLVVILAAAGGVYFSRWARGTGRVIWDGFKLKVPVLGSVLRTIAVGRFARALGALSKGGVTILESLSVVRETLGNEVLGRQIDKVAEEVKAGAPLAGPLEESGYFPPLLVQIVSVGEQTGKLDELLLDAADTFDAEADSAIAKFLAVFPAVLILFLALVIGFIIAATLLPIVMMELGGAGF